ncbi:efflux transporter outer membrane subunit [Sphingomonas sp. CL5.1]|uniref:efflux transporter outer membrane subunit n=1 Tax=Sphingomonas sp. CL5.1 TaxID=2653203 RepID=UPI0015820445|nr:efflux transporter outer membrane subunit [Sphingomonas sp. CL5.1]QKR98946.1 efflux transporter outer membrane subunit [Sphingomonas sp. CL5.1]
MRTPLALLPLVALAACTVGPDYAGPSSAGAVRPPAGFVRAADGASTAAPSVAPWWSALGDATLDELERRALAANPDVQVAEARLKQARAGLRLERANALPSGSANATYLHAQLPGFDLGGSGGGGSTALDLYNAGFDASWEIDLFGGQRRKVEAARASIGAAEANVADAQVSLTAEVGQAYVNLRDRQQRIVLARQAAERQRDMLKLTEQREAAGTASALDVERLRGLVEQSDAAILPLTAERDAYLNALAVLAGEAPGALDALLGEARAVPLPPAEVAVGDPAALLQRRPDVRAAERQLAAATAKIGVAEAAKFPRLSFMGLIGIGGSKPGDLLDLGNLSAIAAPQLSWNFLDFGRNAARVGQAEGARDEAAAQYRGAVLGALRDAEDSLSRYAARRLTVASAARGLATADRSARLMRQRFDAGTATLIDVLDAERQRVSAEQALSQATAAMTADYVALQKALGLGWQEVNPPRS